MELLQKESKVRCLRCGRLLARGWMEVGDLEIHCPRCKAVYTLRASRPNQAPHDGLYGDRHDLKKTLRHRV